ncbi:MAG TPA: OmpA family protein [Spirochaetota bacterium]|nr:OmpA family protein [Spirochaetota bacterium]
MAKKKAEAEKENSERWLLTYSDMITLLMLFFIVLYSMSQTDVGKYMQLAQALETVFTGGNWGIFDSYAKAGNNQQFDKGRGLLNTDDKYPLMKNKPPAKRKKVYNQAIQMLQPYIKADRVRVISTETGITISLSSDLFFDPGSADIVQENTAVLDTVSDLLKALPNNIRIEGHTDNQPLRPENAKYMSNWELSSQRSINILEYFERKGVGSKNMSAVAFGSTRPIEENNTPEGRAYNRRVDVVIVDQDGLPTNVKEDSVPEAGTAAPR